MITVGKNFMQRHTGFIDGRANAAVANSGMYGVGEIQGRSAPGESLDIAFWGKHIDLIRKQVGFQVLQVFP